MEKIQEQLIAVNEAKLLLDEAWLKLYRVAKVELTTSLADARFMVNDACVQLNKVKKELKAELEKGEMVNE